MIQTTIFLSDGRNEIFTATNRHHLNTQLQAWFMRVPERPGVSFAWQGGRCTLLQINANQWTLDNPPRPIAVGLKYDYVGAYLAFVNYTVRYGAKDVGPGFLVTGPAGGEAGLAAFVEGQDGAGYRKLMPPAGRVDRDEYLVWGKELSAYENLGDAFRAYEPDGPLVRGEADLPALELPGRSLIVQKVRFIP